MRGIRTQFINQAGVRYSGGGAVLRAQNVRALRQNGVVVYIDRPLGQLAVGGARPLSQSAEALAAMHAARAPLYAAACDARVENDGQVSFPVIHIS